MPGLPRGLAQDEGIAFERFAPRNLPFQILNAADVAGQLAVSQPHVHHQVAQLVQAAQRVGVFAVGGQGQFHIAIGAVQHRFNGRFRGDYVLQLFHIVLLGVQQRVHIRDSRLNPIDISAQGGIVKALVEYG